MSFQTHRSTSAVSIIGRIRARKLTLAIVGTGTTNVDTKCVCIYINLDTQYMDPVDT